jgi:ATP-binding cassette subfamily G (WHITE) protein 2 (PDR)
LLLAHSPAHVRPQGVTGADKTTLLNVLASRMTMGVIAGDMHVNGHQCDQSLECKTGYVQQADLRLATSTVRGPLQFSAQLRQPRSTSEAEKLASVEEMIALLEMGNYAEAVVVVLGEA